MAPREAFYAPFNGPSDVPSPLTSPHWLPLAPHPGNPAPPAPLRPPHPPPPEGWTRTFHAVPAAYPRQLKEATGTYGRSSHPFRESGPEPKTSAERKARSEKEGFKAAEARWGGHEWSMDEALAASPKGLFVAVERWRRDKLRGGHTVVCSHANGMQKEHWQPVLRRIIASEGGEPDYAFGTDKPLPATPVLLDDIWMFDDANHGASVDLNAGLLGPGQIWDDTARDLVNFIVHVLPAAREDEKMASACFPWHLPWQLPWRPDGDAPAIKVIGFGASFGGLAQARAAAFIPDRYEGLFLADPMLPPRTRTWENVLEEPETMLLRVRQAVKRRDTWSSREEARTSMLKSPFYAAFHPEQFDLVVSHGLVKAPNGVTLATPAWCEAAVFCEGVCHARGWDRLPGLNVPIAFFMARENDRTMGDELTRELVWRPPLARNERSLSAGHLLVQEDPDGTAEAAKRFLATLDSGRWGNSLEEIRASYDEETKARL
ncbi:hypothetical protein CcaverHIS002_0402740 [Cutaneotrichosporon cavernicola]|uniref:Alpha/beta-hydrolase n=1 Tax=Cutaneotrichosporon cavernicola TaxID=279322 RepID=A0AA48L3U4_9TREE|nr:uncharacterized protein CcaverHIS019_0402700 [Cutaneotrichosporon cavernicola]BEI83670.1 hypothetical protein CcaverHIS002_0402740 [Cutaneotrichosporon cavernicola]BEI91450.1 hypothetical protein CcaverHIS019_0402700 [Cutaneotrichosporon cavernicola]BEI99224.1 hypothetical protein CcaverHIS631_0402670 [Cutaneotrichosporon cavernicola]BEJ07001.1 hypothetical protein CcaverHIS641_0402700 [Cutaneotrichosporon cavernicola]